MSKCKAEAEDDPITQEFLDASEALYVELSSQFQDEVMIRWFVAYHLAVEAAKAEGDDGEVIH